MRTVRYMTVLVVVMLLSLGVAGAAVADTSSLGSALLAAGQNSQVIQFNPDAALQKRIFADGCVPNSAEFSLTFDSVAYIGQRAENLGSGLVRVYFARVGDWAHVGFYQRGVGGSPLGEALLARAEQKQVIEFNPGAALQKRIFEASFVPNSGEFSLSYNGLGYTAQRAESLMSGAVRVYYARVGDWSNVRYVERGNPDDTAGSASYGSALHHYAIVYPADWTRLVNLPESGRDIDLETVTLRQPGYGTAGKFSEITVQASHSRPPTTGLTCSLPNFAIGSTGVRGCRQSLPGGQNPPSEHVTFQRGQSYYQVSIIYSGDTGTQQNQQYVFNQILLNFMFLP